MPTAKAQRQPSSPSGTSTVPMIAAAIQPTAQNASSSTTIRPRIARGENSETRVDATGSSAPRPSPMTKRRASSMTSPVDRAAAPVASP